MSPKREDQQQIRAVVSKDVYALLKALAGLKQASLNQVLNEAIDRYLEDKDNQELIQRHNLEEQS
jgi:hypothetical protein